MGPNSGTFNPSLITYGGQQWPDIVGALHVKQGWGEAQVSGVIHNVNVMANGFDGSVVGKCAASLARPFATDAEQGRLGRRRRREGQPAVVRRGRRSRRQRRLLPERDNCIRVINDGMWSENGQVNGNGQADDLGADAFFNPITNHGQRRRAWSVLALLEHHFTPRSMPIWKVRSSASSGAIMGGGCNSRCRLPPRSAGRRARCRLTRLAGCRRGYWLEPGDQPELRS